MTVLDKTLTVGIPAYWGTVMPPLQHSVYGGTVLENQFEPLTRQGKNGLIEPLAASSWEYSPDYRVLRFKIDTSRRFSDGSRLTAADFKRSWEDGLRLNAKSSNKSVLDALYNVAGFSDFEKEGTIRGIRVLADEALEIDFDKPLRVAVEYLSEVRYAAYRMSDGEPIGTGPYVMKERGQELELSPNPYYAGSERRFARGRIVVAENSVRSKLQSGEIDAALFAQSEKLPECLDGSAERIRCVFGQESSHLALLVNGLGGRTFADAENRLALQALVSRRLAKIELPVGLKSSHFMRDPQSFLRFQPGRIPDAEAERVLARGDTLVPKLVEASRKRPILLALANDASWLVDMLRESGVALAPESGVVDFTRLLKMIYKTHEPDLIYGSFSVYNGDPDGLYHILGRHGAIYSPMMERPGIADLLDSGREILDHDRLAPHYEKVGRAVLEEVPYVHLGYTSIGIAYNAEKLRVTDSFINRNNQRVTLFEPR